MKAYAQTGQRQGTINGGQYTVLEVYINNSLYTLRFSEYEYSELGRGNDVDKVLEHIASKLNS